MTAHAQLNRAGWCRFEHDSGIADWVAATHPVARALASDPAQIAQWLRCGGTWFAGVNILPNDTNGALQDGPVLRGQAIEFINDIYGAQRWDKAQISVIYPGYPRPMPGESPSAFRFRRDRDAAHVDGLLPVGPDKRRHLHEPHGFVLGLPLTSCTDEASPMVIWEGSHKLMQAAFGKALAGVPVAQWREVDLTDIYQSTRRICFETCPRVAIMAQPGEAYLVHRLALHGVAPWGKNAVAPPEGRMIAYFRPELVNHANWLA